MRDLIAACGALFVIVGAIVFAIGALFVLLGTAGSGSPAALALLLPGGLGSAAIVLVGGLTWMATEQDKRLERIEAMIRAHTPSGTPSPAAARTPVPDWVKPNAPRMVIIGSEAPGPRPTTLPALPRVGAEAPAGWYWRGNGPAEVWHPGGPVSWEAHDR